MKSFRFQTRENGLCRSVGVFQFKQFIPAWETRPSGPGQRRQALRCRQIAFLKLASSRLCRPQARCLALWARMFVGVLIALWWMPGPASAAPPLASYAIQKDGISVSGLSSGGYMAVQMHVAFSKTFMGAGVVAGGPYYCAEGDVMKALGRCMNDADVVLPPAAHFRDITDAQADNGRIDPVSHLSSDRVWLFTGGRDERVLTRVMDRLQEYYLQYLDEGNIAYERDTLPGAGHAMITENYGNACDYHGTPYINDCDFDAAGELLKHIYGSLSPSVAAKPENLITFDQSEFSGSVSLGGEGYLYVPDACKAGAGPCRLHVAFHGCSQNKDAIGDQFARNSGYNPWAEANSIIVLYPQTGQGATNQCWDWWGYGELGLEKRYHTRDGVQMAAVKAMMDRISRAAQPPPPPPGYCGTDTNAGHTAAGRAYRFFFFFYFATGSKDYLGMSGSANTTLKEGPEGHYAKVAVCP